MNRMTFETRLGTMLAVATEKGLCGLEFATEERLAILEGRLRRWYECDRETGVEQAVLSDTAAWLDSYFSGAPTAQLPLLDIRGTVFERAVWRALLDIPFGHTESYGSVARRLGCPKSARAVGYGVGCNPLGILVPCHRVVGADGSLTGYGGGVERKRWLLAHEASNVDETVTTCHRRQCGHPSHRFVVSI